MSDIEVTATEQKDAGVRAFIASQAGTPGVTLVVWDRASDMHAVGEVWGLFVEGRAPRSVDGLSELIDAVVFAARACYGNALHVVRERRGLSTVEARAFAALGLVAA